MLSAPMGVQGEFVFTTKMLFALLLLTSTSFGQVVDLPQGQIKGDTLVSRAGLSYSAFRSIPYASPPVGSLRWAPPQPAPVPGWEGTRNGSLAPPYCFQPMYDPPFFHGEEDCLYLNIFTSKVTEEKGLVDEEQLPVMVWIHGGAFRIGRGFSSEESGFLVDQDVVIVSINYRLDLFGFFSLDTDNISGNQGLRDQAVALEWVQENIHLFGGDRGQVTIFGESAGGWSVSHQLVNPAAEGLFRGAIIQSGPITGGLAGGLPLSRASAKEQGLLLAGSTGCFSGGDLDQDQVDEVVQCLQSKAPEEMLLWALLSGFSVAANVDDFSQQPVLPEQPQTLLDSGNFHHVPVILGVNSGEEIMFRTSMLDDPSVLDEYSTNWNLVCPTLILGRDPSKNGSDFGANDKAYCEAALPFYFNSSLNQDCVQKMLDLLNDAHFFRGTHAMARSLASQVATYQYMLTFRDETSETATPGPNSPNDYLQYGVSHADDIYYIFKHNFDYNSWSEANLATSHAMCQMWGDFARYGDPTPPASTLEFSWEPVEPENHRYLDIGEVVEMDREYWYGQRMDFWDEIIVD